MDPAVEAAVPTALDLIDRLVEPPPTDGDSRR